MEYKKIYSFEVTEKIHDGKQVFMVDKRLRTVHCINDMSVGAFMQIARNEDTSERYAFWYEEEVENG